MINTSVKYLGLTLKNPIIAGSCGLTNTIENLQELEKAGAGAIVLKSIFEEQIRLEAHKFMTGNDDKMKPMNTGFNSVMNSRSYDYAEAMGYMENFAKEHTLDKYLDFIKEAKQKISIPIIASINCTTAYDWQYFARRIENAGADALELNLYLLPSNPETEGNDYEAHYFNLVTEIKKFVTIPVALKISYYFSGLAHKIIELSKTGVNGLVLFNRPYSPDFDLNSLQITGGNIYSTATEYSHTLRWMAILSGRLGCDVAASTGIHDSHTVIKQLLAGANAVQLASVFYKKGFNVISEILKELEQWMAEHKYSTIDEFRGKLNQQNIKNPADLERVQFMKLYSKIE